MRKNHDIEFVPNNSILKSHLIRLEYFERFFSFTSAFIHLILLAIISEFIPYNTRVTSQSSRNQYTFHLYTS